MAFARKAPGLKWIAGLCLAAAVSPSAGAAEPGLPSAPAPEHPEAHQLSTRFPDKPSIPPAWSIAVEPLGFAAPGPNYLGMRNAMASLDFLGEDRLLFTFRVPGLMKREPGSTASDQREIRAVVLSIPSGAVQAEDTWTVHDRLRYVWPLDDAHFLLRDRDSLYQCDAALDRKPVLHFPGPLISIQLNPGRQYIVANSNEPVRNAIKPASGAADAQDDPAPNNPDLVLRILSRDSGKVLLVTRVHEPVMPPLNEEGVLNAQRGTGPDWEVALSAFTGQTRVLNTVKSTCEPDLDFLSESEALVTACASGSEDALLGLTTDGRILWTDLDTDRLIWPLLTASRNGLRFVREGLYMSHGLDSMNPFGGNDVRGQWVRVLDSATGNVVFETQATPVLDAGGNVALSPSGRRVAVLNGGSIQIFELPAAPALPGPKPGH